MNEGVRFQWVFPLCKFDLSLACLITTSQDKALTMSVRVLWPWRDLDANGAMAS